jgi:hypothetical protein
MGTAQRLRRTATPGRTVPMGSAPSTPVSASTGAHQVAPGRWRSAPGLALLRTADGWALCDGHDRALYEAEGADARRSCLTRALELGAVCLRSGEKNVPSAR